MARRFDLVVFDWDGTIMDSTGLIAECIRKAAEAAGLPPPDESAAKAVIGLSVADSVRRLFKHADATAHATFAAYYRAYFMARDHALPLYDGMRELLAELDANGRLLAVATGKSRRGLDRALAHSGLAGRFHATRCADEGFAKPHPDMLYHLMRVTGVEAGRTLMIGDTTHDLELAANAGTLAVGVSYGAHSKGELVAARPLAVADSVAQLRDWLHEHA
jgi:phosphoglycolate phosphatase